MAATESASSVNLPGLSERVAAMVQDKANPDNIATTFKENHGSQANLPQLRSMLACAAVKYNHLQLLRFLMEGECGAVSCNAQGRSNQHDTTSCPLHVAVEADKTEVVEVLLQHGCEPPMRSESGERHPWSKCNIVAVASIAINRDNAKVLSSLIRCCNIQLHIYRILFKHACRVEARACFECLLNKPEFVEMKMVDDEYNPLCAAVSGDSIYCTRRLIQYGLLSSCPKTILHSLQCSSDNSIAILKTLLNTKTIDVLAELDDGVIALETFIGRFYNAVEDLPFTPMHLNVEHCLSLLSRFRKMVHLFLDYGTEEQASRAIGVALANYGHSIPVMFHKRDRWDSTRDFLRVLPEILSVGYDTVKLLFDKGAKPSTYHSSHFPVEFSLLYGEYCHCGHRRPGTSGHQFPTYTAPELVVASMAIQDWESFRVCSKETDDMVTAKMEAVFRLLLNHGATGVEPSTFVTLLTQDPDRHICFLDLYLASLPLPQQISYMEGLQSELENQALLRAMIYEVEVLEVLKSLQKAIQERHEVCLTLKYMCRCQLLLSARGERQQFVKALPLPESLKSYMLGV